MPAHSCNAMCYESCEATLEREGAAQERRQAIVFIKQQLYR